MATKVIDWSKGQLSYAPFYFIVSHHMIFFAGYILIEDITIGWLIANIWHNAQYILFVWLFNQMRFKDQNTQKSSPFLHWLCQKSPYRTLAYFTFFICATSIIYNSLTAGVELISGSDATAFTAFSIIIFQTINFHHYIVDSQIWKARKKTHQKIMKITEN